MPLSLNIGDTVELKKQHACGCKEFEIIRVGMDIKHKGWRHHFPPLIFNI